MPLKSRTRGRVTAIKRSRNSYILLLRSVTRQPIGIALRSLKFEISFLDNVGTAFCPEMLVISFTASSIIFLSDTEPLTPWFKHILTKRGHCITDVYPNFFIKAGT